MIIPVNIISYMRSINLNDLAYYIGFHICIVFYKPPDIKMGNFGLSWFTILCHPKHH